MTLKKQAPATGETVARGDAGQGFGGEAHNIGATGDRQVERLHETLSITTRRLLDGDLPASVRIRRIDGVTMKLRPGPATSAAEFNALVAAVIAVVRGAP